MLPLPKLRNRWSISLVGFALSLLFLHWYLGISNVLFHPSQTLDEFTRAGHSQVDEPVSGNGDEVKKTSANAASPIPSLPPLTKKTIVMARLKNEDVSWVANELPDWSSAIYTVDDPDAVLKPPKNKGNEAMVYLSYLIDYYDNLPPVSVFIHAHKDGYPKAWHTDAEDYSNVNSLTALRLDTVLAKGYVNLRCNWTPGCPDEIQPFRTTDADRTAEHGFTTAWKEMFGNSSTSPKVPSVVGAACCAQFAVSKEQILARSKSEYETYRNWLLDTPLDNSTSGRIFEYLWHIIFGAPAVFCPDYFTCFCDVYGRC